MPFTIVRDDITHVKADAIVNTANPAPAVGSGVDAALYKAAGEGLFAARQEIGSILPGHCAATPAFRLPARCVLHTVAPVWQGGGCGEKEVLRRCYDSCLALALEKGCRSIAFPLLATGNNSFPKELALQIAIGAFSAFLPLHEMDITLVVFRKEAFVLSEKLVASVESYIDDHYVQEAEDAEISPMLCSAAPRPARRMPDSCAGLPLEKQLQDLDAGFSETLLHLIDRTGKKDAEIYQRAGVDRKLFSKIRTDPGYHPSKATAVAFCMALELSVDEAQELLKRAGYTLSRSSKFDVIAEYFLTQKNYDIPELDAVLFRYDQPLVGSR